MEEASAWRWHLELTYRVWHLLSCVNRAAGRAEEGRHERKCSSSLGSCFVAMVQLLWVRRVDAGSSWLRPWNCWENRSQRLEKIWMKIVGRSYFLSVWLARCLMTANVGKGSGDSGNTRTWLGIYHRAGRSGVEGYSIAKSRNSHCTSPLKKKKKDMSTTVN